MPERLERSAALAAKFDEGIDRRRFVAGSLRLGVAALGLGVIACGDDDDGGGGSGTSGAGGGGKKQIAFAQPDTGFSGYPLLLGGVKSAAAARGYTVLESHAQSKLDKQVSELNTWIAQKVPGIMVLPLDNKAMGPIIKRAHENGVKILDYSDKALPGVDGYVIFDNLQGAALVGKNAGEWVNKTLGGQAKVALLTHEIQQTGRDRIHGAVKALQEVAPGAKVVAKHEAVLANDALPVVQSMLQANPDLNMILCIADDGCLGAEKAFMQTKPSKDRVAKMYIAGWDGTPPVYKKIIAGSAIRATGALPLDKVGNGVAETTINAIEGKKPTGVAIPYVLASQDDLSVVRDLLQTSTQS